MNNEIVNNWAKMITFRTHRIIRQLSWKLVLLLLLCLALQHEHSFSSSYPTNSETIPTERTAISSVYGGNASTQKEQSHVLTEEELNKIVRLLISVGKGSKSNMTGIWNLSSHLNLVDSSPSSILPSTSIPLFEVPLNLEERPLPQEPPHSVSDLEVLEFWPWQAILIALYSIAAVASLSMNIMTISILLKSDRSITNELWKFLICLCVSDIGMSIFCIPTTYTQVMLQRWIFPNWLCPVVSFAQLCFVFISVWSLVLIGIDRYFAIVHPLYMIDWMRKCRLTIIIITCLMGSCLGLIPMYFTKIRFVERHGLKVAFCGEVWPAQYSRYFTILVFITTLALPLGILFFVYLTIFLRIMKHTTPGNPDSLRDQTTYKRKIKVLRLLITMVFAFLFCWVPLHVFQFLVEFKNGFTQPRSHLSAVMFYVAFYICHYLSMIHSSVNPIIYVLCLKKFRTDMARKLKFCKIKRCFVSRGSQQTENIEMLNVQYQYETYTSRMRKTNTKLSAGSQLEEPNNKQNSYSICNNLYVSIGEMANNQSVHSNHKNLSNGRNNWHQAHLHCHPCSQVRVERLSNSSTNSANTRSPYSIHVDTNRSSNRSSIHSSLS